MIVSNGRIPNHQHVLRRDRQSPLKAMKAVVYTTYGSPEVLELKDVPRPTPGEGEVLVRVCAAAANPADWHLMRGSPVGMRLATGLRKPKNTGLGADMAGVVEEAGENVTAFQPGDEVFADLASSGFGAFAEYAVAPENLVVRKPANLSFEEAAAVPLASVTALQALRDKGGIQLGQQVLINGASGGVGTFAVQIAKAFGAYVTGVCSTKNLDLVRSVGADDVIDYTKHDVTRLGRRFDLIVDAAAYRPLSDYKRALTAKGTYVMVGGSNGQIFRTIIMGPLLSITSSKTMTMLLARPDKEDLTFIKELIEARSLKPVIGTRYTLSEVREVVREVETGHTRGKIVIRIGSETQGAD